MRIEHGLPVEKRESKDAAADKGKKEGPANATSASSPGSPLGDKLTDAPGQNFIGAGAAAEDTGKHGGSPLGDKVTDAPGQNFIGAGAAADDDAGKNTTGKHEGKQEAHEAMKADEAVEHLAKHKKRGSHHGKAAEQQDNMTVALCSMMTLRMEAPHLLPWIAYHLLIGVDQIHLYHDDRSRMRI